MITGGVSISGFMIFIMAMECQRKTIPCYPPDSFIHKYWSYPRVGRHKGWGGSHIAEYGHYRQVFSEHGSQCVGWNLDSYKLDAIELETLIASIRDRVESRSNLFWKEQGDTKLIFQEVHSKPKSTQPQFLVFYLYISIVWP